MTLKITILLLTSTIVIKCTKPQLTEFIVGGHYSSIKDFPHSVFLYVQCDEVHSSCGASILNQILVLTAAHCVARDCNRHFHIRTYTGAVRKYKGSQINVVNVRKHENYDEVSVANDIALLKLAKDVTFGNNVKRVMIMRDPPSYQTGVIAGWGAVNLFGKGTNLLKHTEQQILSNYTCHQLLRYVPPGTICGRESSYPECGDSGSALIINKYIQIGILSFKIRPYSNDTLVYTDISHFFDWIIYHAELLNCNERRLFKSIRYKQSKQIKVRGMRWQKTAKPECIYI